MSDAQGSNPPAGWYPDPAGGTLQRYWDGVAWSDRTYDPSSASSVAGSTLDPEVSAVTSWVWIIAALPVISLIAVASIDYRQYLLDAIAQPTAPGSVPGLPAGFGTQLLLGALGWLVYLGSVLLTYFDWRALVRRGVPTPFHWAWTFLGAIVYLIGRPVVLRRRGLRRSAFAPMWLYIVLLLLIVVASIAKVADALPAVIDRLPTYG